jgi:hypothetical protein
MLNIKRLEVLTLVLGCFLLIPTQSKLVFAAGGASALKAMLQTEQGLRALESSAVGKALADAGVRLPKAPRDINDSQAVASYRASVFRALKRVSPQVKAQVAQLMDHELHLPAINQSSGSPGSSGDSIKMGEGRNGLLNAELVRPQSGGSKYPEEMKLIAGALVTGEVPCNVSAQALKNAKLLAQRTAAELHKRNSMDLGLAATVYVSNYAKFRGESNEMTKAAQEACELGTNCKAISPALTQRICAIR